MSEITITAKIKILPADEQKPLLIQTVRAVKSGLNYTSKIVFDTKEMVQAKLHKLTYSPLREQMGLRSQMAQSVMKTVIAKYRSMKSNGVKDTFAVFKKPEYDLVWNRDYSLVKGLFSVNTLEGRIQVPFRNDKMELFFDGTWSFGTAKLVMKKNRFYLHIPMSKEIDDVDLTCIRNVVGVDLGINFLAVTYDSKDKTIFYSGKQVKQKRAHYKEIRRQLQMRQTPSARRRLKSIGSRESRWMTDVNHCVSKALVERAGHQALIALEDLTNVRQATERVRRKYRYVSVSWSFAQLRQFIEYKAKLNQSLVVAFDPRHTSQSVRNVVIPNVLTGIRKSMCFVVKRVGTPPTMIELVE